MKKFWSDYIASNLFFWVFSSISAVLIIAGFICPPIGQIDNSVLVAAGELNGTIALGCILRAIDKGVDASIKHNGTEVSIGQKEEGE